METQLKNSFFTLSFVSAVLGCIWNLICGVLDLIASSVLTSTGLATSKTDDGLNLALAQLQETFINSTSINTSNDNISPSVSVKLENECDQSMIAASVEQVKFIEEISHQQFIDRINKDLDENTPVSAASSLTSSVEDDDSDSDDEFHDSELAFPDEKADPESIATVDVKEKAKKKRRRGKKKSQKVREALQKEKEQALLASGMTPEQVAAYFIENPIVKPVVPKPEKKQPTPKKEKQPQPLSPQKQTKKDKESKSTQGKADFQSRHFDATKKFGHSALKHDKVEEKKIESVEEIKVIRQPIGPSLGNNGFSAEYQRSRRAAMKK